MNAFLKNRSEGSVTSGKSCIPQEQVVLRLEDDSAVFLTHLQADSSHYDGNKRHYEELLPSVFVVFLGLVPHKNVYLEK